MLTASVLTGACGGNDPNEPRPQPKPGITAVAGAALTDTVLAQPVQALVVEVRGPDGQLARNTVVRFGAARVPSPGPSGGGGSVRMPVYVCPLGAPVCGPRVVQFGTDWAVGDTVALDTTDANGRAKAAVRLGTMSGPVAVRITVPEFGMVDSATYTVNAGAPAGLGFATRDTTLSVGGQLALKPAVVDRHGNARPEQPTLTLRVPGTVDLAAGTVTAREIGTAWVVARAGSAVDSAVIRVVPSGRLVVWEPGANRVRLINFDGTSGRTLVTGVHSDFGVFPRFDPSRERVTLHTGEATFGGSPRTGVVLDTAGGRRDIRSAELGSILAVRQMADGSVLLVAVRAAGNGAALWKADAAGAVTHVADLPEFASVYGGADISADGSRVVFAAGAGGFGVPRALRVLEVATGAVTTIAGAGRSPRWSPSGDRVAYLDPSGESFFNEFDGALAVVGADGTGRRTLTSKMFSPGLAWSPDGAYVVGRNSAWQDGTGLRVVRVRDGVDVLVAIREQHQLFGNPELVTVDVYQPDWR